MNENVLVMFILCGLFSLLFAFTMWAYLIAIKQNKDLHEKLMARNLTEYGNFKVTAAIADNVKKPAKEEEQHLKEGEIE